MVAFVSLVVGVAHAGSKSVLEWVWSVEGDQAEAWLGSAVAGAGDVNGDGFDDVLVAAHRYNAPGSSDEGRVDLYLGSTAGPEETAAWTMIGDQWVENFGVSVASAGDVNGDGFADVIVGALFYDDGETDEGAAFLFLGSSSGLETSASWTTDGDDNSVGFGKSVASAGDVNGDGFGDVIVGANWYDGVEDSEGKAFVYHGSKDGLSKLHAWSSAGPAQGYAQFGVSVASAGDVNGDGFSDVIVGCLNYENGSDEEGGAFVFLGSDSGLELVASWIAEPDQEYTQFGISVASAGDVNGDGYDDVLVGAAAYEDPTGETDEGHAFLYLGSLTGLSSSVWSTTSGEYLANLGTSVASAGDVNSDGFADVLVGVPYWNAGGADRGSVSLFLGSASGLASADDWSMVAEADNSSYGWSVSSAGDVNGDGSADVIVGANQYDDPAENAGQASVYLGAPSSTGDDGGGDDGTGDDSGVDDSGVDDSGASDDSGAGDDGGGDDGGGDVGGNGDDGSADDDDGGCGCGGAPGGSLYTAMLALAALTRRYRPAP